MPRVFTADFPPDFGKNVLLPPAACEKFFTDFLIIFFQIILR
jgi:hypothetical protein